MRFCKCEQFREARSVTKNFNEEEQIMAKVEKGKKVVLFEVTSKKADELLDKKNETNAAIFYRVLVAADKPMTRVAIYEASKSKCESAAAWERLGHQTHDTLARLRKLGFVKRIETREEIKAKPAMKAAAKPRAPRKPKPAQQAPQVEVQSAAASA
jgi:hypothetical protein